VSQDAVIVRVAGPEDGPRIAALRRGWVEENAGATVVDDDFDASFEEWFSRERDQRVIWLADAGGETVGMLNLLIFRRMPRPGRTQSRWGYLANFYVRPDHRGSGLGQRLLTACTEYADGQGLVRIVLSPSERSVSLYRRLGFATATELMLRPGTGD
jgi:GNAT superfamily N-acetyltransferase